MKFAKHLLKAVDISDPEWLPYWINYKLLKKCCKRLSPERTCENDMASYGHTDSSLTVMGDSLGNSKLGNPRDQVERLASNHGETFFFKALKREIQKCSEFFCSVELHNRVRLARLQTSLEQQLEPASVCQGSNAARKLMQSCVNLYKDVLLLEDFAMVNYMAVSKALKKHDKISGFATREKFMVNIMTRQPFSLCTSVHALLGNIELIFEQAESLAVNEKSSLSTGSQEKQKGNEADLDLKSSGPIDDDTRNCINAILELKRQSSSMHQEEFQGNEIQNGANAPNESFAEGLNYECSVPMPENCRGGSSEMTKSSNLIAHARGFRSVSSLPLSSQHNHRAPEAASSELVPLSDRSIPSQVCVKRARKNSQDLHDDVV